jgi:hypothetical protein
VITIGNKTSIRTQKGYFYCNKVWFVAKESHFILSLDIQSGEIELEKKLNFFDNRHGHFINGNENAFYIISAHGTECLKYNIADGNIVKIDSFDNKAWEDNEFYRIMGTAIWNYKMLLFPGCIDEFGILDTRYDELYFCKAGFESIEKLFGARMYNHFGAGIYNDHGKVLLPGFDRNYYAIFDLASEECSIHGIENEASCNGYRYVTACNDFLYLVNKRQHVMKYDRGTGKLLEIISRSGCNEFSCVLCCDFGYLWIPAFQVKPYLIWEDAFGNLTTIKYPDSYECFLDCIPKEQGILVAESNDEYFFMPHLSNIMICVDKRAGNVRFLELHYGKRLLNYIQNLNGGFFKEEKIGLWHPNQDGIIREYSLIDFINSI